MGLVDNVSPDFDRLLRGDKSCNLFGEHCFVNWADMDVPETDKLLRGNDIRFLSAAFSREFVLWLDNLSPGCIKLLRGADIRDWQEVPCAWSKLFSIDLWQGILSPDSDTFSCVKVFICFELTEADLGIWTSADIVSTFPLLSLVAVPMVLLLLCNPSTGLMSVIKIVLQETEPYLVRAIQHHSIMENIGKRKKDRQQIRVFSFK